MVNCVSAWTSLINRMLSIKVSLDGQVRIFAQLLKIFDLNQGSSHHGPRAGCDPRGSFSGLRLCGKMGENAMIPGLGPRKKHCAKRWALFPFPVKFE